MNASSMIATSLDQLEFGRVLEHIAGMAASSLGVEQIANLEPIAEIDECRQQVSMVSEMRAILLRDEDLPLHGVWDVRESLALARIHGAVLSPENLLHVRSSITAIRKVRDFLMRRRESAPLLAAMVSDLHVNRLLEKHIDDAIDDVGSVRDSASRDLARVRRDIVDRSAALRSRLQKILRRVSEEELVTDEYITLREGRLVLPVRAEAKRRIPGIIHGESHSGGTVFLEPAEIFDMNNEIAELTFAERREVEKILRTLTEEVGTESAQFAAGLIALGTLDSIWARARYAVKYNCTEPEISERDEIVLQEARHPLLLLRLEHVVPMSIELDVTRRAVIVSGPNAGGKTVAMKTLGLVCMLALSGIHPPAATCRVHPCRIFADIGDQQSLENDLSTFSSHMSRIAAILSEAHAGDVVLLDEIGTGTDPDEGGAIAASVVEYLIRRGSFLMATTHHSYLKVFAYEMDGVENAGMEFDTRTITPTYRFMIGIPGNSYAFELLERLGFEPSVLTSARARLGDERNRMTEIIGELEESLTEGRRALDEGRRARDEADALRQRYELEAKDLHAQRRDLIAAARQEARQIVATANSQIENALREIREGASDARVRELRKQIDDVRATLQPPSDESRSVDDAAFSVGDAVRIAGGSQVGEVIVEPDAKGYAIVQFGAVRMRSSIADLERVSRRDVRGTATTVGRMPVTNVGELESRIDIRGMYPDEAVVRLEQAITAAMNANLTHMDIIHGKGTGALRARVHEYLRTHPGVASFRLGALTEGGAGITVVELK